MPCTEHIQVIWDPVVCLEALSCSALEGCLGFSLPLQVETQGDHNLPLLPCIQLKLCAEPSLHSAIRHRKLALQVMHRKLALQVMHRKLALQAMQRKLAVQIMQRKVALQVIHRNSQGKLIWQARLGLAFQLLPSPTLQLLDLLQAVT